MVLEDFITLEDLKLFPSGIYGHKRHPALLEKILKYVPDDTKCFADIFAGTAVVGSVVKRAGCTIISNDIMRFPQLRAKVFVQYNGKPPTESDLINLGKPNMNQKKVFQTYYGGFMGDHNATYLDNVAANIQEMETGRFRDIAILLAVLAIMQATKSNATTMHFSPVGNLTGGRHYFNIDFREKVLRFGLDILPKLIWDNGQKNEVFGLDALDFISMVNPDVAYIDSPYAACAGTYEHHLSFYDKVIMILTGEEARIKSFYGFTAYLPPYNDFVCRSNALINLSRLIHHARHIPKLIVSYNTSSLISADELKAVAESHGRSVHLDFIEYRRPTTIKGGVKSTMEVLMVCE